MQEQGQTVVIKINVDEAAYKKKIVDLQKDIINVKKQEQELAKAIKVAGSATDEQIAQQIELKNQLKGLTAQQRLYQSGLDAKAKTEAAAAGSIKQMSLALSEMKKEYRDLSKEDRESDLGVKMQQNMKALNDELKGLEQSYGQFGRSVGDYTGGILQAVDGTGLLATITTKAKGAQEAYTATLNITKASLAGNISLLKGLKLALAATGIGAVLLLLGGLVSWLTSTQEGIDKVNQASKSITTVMSFLRDRLSDVGKATIDWFSDIKDLGDLLQKLADGVIENVTSRIKGFAVILEAIQNRDFNKLQDGLLQVGTGIADGTSKAKAFAKEVGGVAVEAAKIEKEFQRIAKAEISLGRERDKSRSMIKDLNFIAEDTAKSEKERAAAAQKALAIEQGLLQKQIKLQQDKVNNIKAEQNLTYNGNDEDRALADAESALFQLNESSKELQTTLNNKINSINKEAVAKRVALAKDLTEKEQAERLQRLSDEKAALEIEVLQAIEGTQERLEAKIRLAAKGMEIELSAKNLTEKQKQLIRVKFDQEEIEARREQAEKLVAIAKDQADKEAAARKLKADTILEEARQQASRNVEARQQEADQKAEIAQAEYESALLISQSIGDIATLLAAKSEEAANFQKAITLFQIGLASAEAIAKGIAAASAAGPFPANLIAIATTVATVTGNLVRAKELLSSSAAPKAPQFAEGGYTGDGGKYEPAGIVHKGEYVLNQRMVRNNPELVEKLEQMRLRDTNLKLRLEAVGLRGYASGGVVTAPAYTIPPSTREFLSGTPIPDIDYRKLAAELGKVNIYTKVTDLSTGLNRQAKTARIINQ
ncbi:hypothetical protein MKJ04_11500 [Pontibacter sp. E15-1]|uniref:hypothetical protein n=1 Tax=Pontibacter sp. E15-1 TaxID=2919918 RepID=UPI001F4F5385|nr:hypothetical protein [Pontibacter sp. E15-1]MCJ8165469.1 hypothetical protein [Pontibacter sp. E15-1]